jgi:hypothetical protein
MKFLGSVLLVVVCLAGAQSKPAAGPAKPEPINPLVQQQFGPSFTVATSQPLTVLAADFDGDGVEDAAIVADSKDPLPDSYQFKYQVADPYHSYFGMGDPRLTAGYGKLDPAHNHQLLVIFGAGPQAWRAATPKAKFVLINVPFDTVEVGRMLVKRNKPPIFVIKALEAQIMDSAVYWDAKKKRWKWQPGDTVN